MPLSVLTNPSGEVIASYGPDGLLSVPFKVLSFSATIGGMTFDSNGNKFTREQIDRLGKLKKGNIVFIQEIKTVGPGGVKKTLSPMMLILN